MAAVPVIPAAMSLPTPLQESPPSPAPAAAGSRARAPLVRLALGLTLSLLTIIGFCLYAAHEIGRLRDEQMALSERNRRDSLQLIRVQNNLSTLAITLRDMTDRTEPYPMAAWASTFDRLELDLQQALELERSLAPARPPGQQQQIADTTGRFWAAVDRALALAGRGDEAAAIEAIRTDALPRHAELVSLVSQLLVRNTQVEEASAAAARDVYTRVVRQIYWLMVILAAAVAVAGVLNIAAVRRAFEEVRTLSGQLRALSWRMLKLQEDVQTSMARELHDEFGQILTAITMLLGRVKRRAGKTVAAPASGAPPADSSPDDARREDPAPDPLISDIDEVHGIAQQTLERIRTQSRLLHPVILDDFGVEQALVWYVDQFSRQHGLPATFSTSGVGIVPPDIAIHIYRIVQEALGNASRHAHASNAWVRLTQTQGILTLEVEDDGRGLPQWRGEAPAGAGGAGGGAIGGIGMTSMRERTELVGGELALVRGAAGGLLIRCVIPLKL
jgi:signal transduction histidine kinase